MALKPSASTTTIRITRIAPDFSLEKTLKFMPFLFFPHNLPKRNVRIGRRILELEFSQKRAGGPINIISERKSLRPNEKTHIARRITQCFGLREDLSQAYNLCEKDPVLSKHFDKIYGTRLLSAFTDFEGLLCILCSHLVSFKQYKRMIQKIYESYDYAFPTPSEILKYPGRLEDCGLGYRVEYLLDAARKCGEGLLPKSLREIRGVGKYSEKIFRLFQERDYSSFYEDSLTARIASTEYGTDSLGLENLWGPAFCGLLEVFAQKFLNDVVT